MKYNINVLSDEETLDYIIKNHSSITRFGDGEFYFIEGNSAVFQRKNKVLQNRLKGILFTESNQKLLICINNVFNGLDEFSDTAKRYWAEYLENSKHESLLRSLEKKEGFFGSASVTRPYMDRQNSEYAKKIFNQFKKIWENKDVLIVEGFYSRTGVNNDLLNNARTVKRIICPSSNAWKKRNKIEKLIKKHGENKVVLLVLGMTATVIAADLANFTQMIDLGHLDGEYEWYLRSAKSKKILIPGKHTPEHNLDIGIKPVTNKTFENEIIADLSKGYRLFKPFKDQWIIIKKATKCLFKMLKGEIDK